MVSRQTFGNFVKQRIFLIVGLAILIMAAGFYWFFPRLKNYFSHPNPPSDTSQVNLPTIINGDLVLPKVTSGTNLGTSIGKSRLDVISANLIAAFDPQSQKLTAIRIIGETQNLGTQKVTALSPPIRFLDKDGNQIGPVKIGHLSSGFDFFGLAPGDKTVYDVQIDNPPASDKLEIVLNADTSTSSALFEPLKIANRAIDIKTAHYQNNDQPPPASPTAQISATESGALQTNPDSIEYYTVSGSVVNGLSDPVTEITIYAYVRDSEGKIFSLGRHDFKNDLLNSGDKLDFKINLLPFKGGEKYDSYDIAAWGRRYKLGT